MSETGAQPLVDIPPGSALASWTDPMMCRLVEVGNETSRGWEDSGYVSGINAFRGHPVMGSKLYCTGGPIEGKLVGRSS